MTAKPLTGKVALVTGASRGIGRAIALRLAGEGADVVVNYQSNVVAAQEVVRKIEDLGNRALAIQANVGVINDLRQMFQKTSQSFGGLDVLVLSAGFFQFKPIAEMTEVEYDALFAVNTKGTFFALQEAARRIRDGGRVIMISAASTGGAGAANNGAATGSKAAAEFFVRSFAREHGARLVTANIISPGPTKTDNFDKLPAEVRANAARMSPLGRVGDVSDIASVAAFLASDEGRWITGQNIRATGGG